MNYCSFNWHRAKRSHSPACFTTWSATDWWLLVTSMTSLDFCSFSSPVPWCGEALDRGFCCCISISGTEKKNTVTIEQNFGFHSYVAWRPKWPSTTPAPNCPPSVCPPLPASRSSHRVTARATVLHKELTNDLLKAHWMDLHVMVQCAGIILQAHSI